MQQSFQLGGKIKDDQKAGLHPSSFLTHHKINVSPVTCMFTGALSTIALETAAVFWRATILS